MSAPTATATTAPAAPPTQPAPAPVAQGPSIPDGFTDAGGGVAYRFAVNGTELVDCSFYDSCIGVVIYGYDGCPSGGYIEANARTESGTIVTFTNDIIPTMQPEDTYMSLLGTIGYGSGLTYELTQIDCY